MTDFTEKKCQKCGQQLRIPKKIGGLLMICPSCGEKIHSDFKLGGVRPNVRRGIIATVFELPYTFLRRISNYFHL